MSEPGVPPTGLGQIDAALRLFDETTAALSAQIRRLEDVLLHKQRELVGANAQLNDKVAELDQLTAWLNLVMGAVGSGVIAVDAQGIITTCNPAARRAVTGAGDAPDDSQGIRLGDAYARLFPDSPLLGLLPGTADRRAGADGSAGPTVLAYERILRLRDGDRRILAAKASPVIGRDGTVIGAVEVFEDVTEVRRLQQSVERADRLKQLGEMAAGVAHEIRNPLNGIGGFASLLCRDLPTDDPRHRYARSIIAGVRDLDRTVSSLLVYTSPRRLEKQSVPIADLVEACVDLVRAQLEHPQEAAEDEDAVDGLAAICAAAEDTNAGERSAAPIAISVEDGLPQRCLLVDGAQMKQVLLNLLQNAVHALQDAGTREPRIRIGIAADQASGMVMITVDDNGPGVPLADRVRIFTPFFTTRAAGTGLGLALVHAIVALHGGTLSVDDSPWGGARFRVMLPG